MNKRTDRNYGQRGRIGMIVPPTNTVNEAEWARMVPDGVTLHAMRMALHEDLASEAGSRRLFEDLRDALAMLVPAGLDAIAYCCTAGSMLQPLERLGDFMRAQSGLPGVATAPALVFACRTLGVDTVALATPYHDALNEHETEFLALSGIRVVSCRGMGIGAGGAHEYSRIARVPQSTVFEHARAADSAAAQAVLISCTDLATLASIEPLERALGKPVVTSNQATLWAALRAAGVGDAVPNAGRLLREH